MLQLNSKPVLSIQPVAMNLPTDLRLMIYMPDVPTDKIVIVLLYYTYTFKNLNTTISSSLLLSKDVRSTAFSW